MFGLAYRGCCLLVVILFFLLTRIIYTTVHAIALGTHFSGLFIKVLIFFLAA